MNRNSRCLGMGILMLVAGLSGPPAALAQGRGHEGRKPDEAKPKVTVQVAVSAAKDVLVRLGYEVVRVEPKDTYQIIYYRAGNRGRGRGQGPPARMIIRRAQDRIVLEDAPEQVRLELGIKLSIKL